MALLVMARERVMGLGKVATALVTAAAMSAVVAGCAGGRYTYISSTSTRTFLKVPSSWKVFPKSQVLAHPGQLGAVGTTSDKFLAEFDADPNPRPDHNFVTADHPFGIVRVHPLTLDQHDQYSLAMLRNEVVPVDQLVQQNPDAVQLVSPSRLLTHQGLRGTKLEYTVHLQGGSSFTIEQIGYVDTPTLTVWYLFVGCSATCYQRNAAAIHRVIDSWTVEGK